MNFMKKSMFLIAHNENFRSENGSMLETQLINGLKLKSWKFEMARHIFTIMDGEHDGMNGLNLILIASNVSEVKLFKMQ